MPLHPKFIRSAPKQIWGAIIGAGASLLGGAMANKSAERNAELNRAQADTSYQRAMADMQAAGLNPMLAFSQGGAPVANAMPQFQNIGSAASQAFAQLETSGASAQQADTASKIGIETIEKTKQEVKNLQSVDLQVKAVTENLRQEYQNLTRHGYNLVEVGNHLRQTIDKMRAEINLINDQGFLAKAQEMLAKAQKGKVENETTLSGLDIQAAQSLGNMGREMQNLGPVLKILVDILSVARPRGGY